MSDIKRWTTSACGESRDVLYPFSQVLRFRVVQIVCGIIMMVMGSVACIEEKGTVTNLGLGVFAGTSTVVAAAICIHASRGFSDYATSRPASSSYSYNAHVLRLLQPTLHIASLLSGLWMIAGSFNVILLMRSLVTFMSMSGEISETSHLLAIVQATLSSSVLLTIVFIARVNCVYDTD